MRIFTCLLIVLAGCGPVADADDVAEISDEPSDCVEAGYEAAGDAADVGLDETELEDDGADIEDAMSDESADTEEHLDSEDVDDALEAEAACIPGDDDCDGCVDLDEDGAVACTATCPTGTDFHDDDPYRPGGTHSEVTGVGTPGCHDGWDNNCDGLTDCDDIDCTLFRGCE